MFDSGVAVRGAKVTHVSTYWIGEGGMALITIKGEG